MANQNTIQLTITVDDKGKAVIQQFGQETSAQLGKVEKSAHSTSSAWTSLQNNWMIASGAIIAAAMAVSRAMVYMDEGAKALQVESSFKIMAESVETNSERMIASMEKATRKTIEGSDLMLKAVKLMTLGYDPSQIERFSNVVITASQIAGISASEAYDQLADAIGNRMPKALIRMGAMTRAQMKIVNEAVAKGADEMALYELAVANLELKQLMLRGTTDQATVAMQQFHAEVKGTKEEIGKELIVVTRGLYGELQFLAAGTLGLTGNMAMLVSVYARYRQIVYETMGDEKKAAENRKVADDAMQVSKDAWAARNELMKKATANIEQTAATEAKATKQELAAGKARVDAQLKVLAATKDTAAAAKKAADEREAAEKAIIEAIRKANIEIEGIGQDQYGKDIARIESEAEKYKKAGVGKALVAKYVAQEMIVAADKVAEEYLKDAEEFRKIVAEEYPFAATENERAINAIIANEKEKLRKIQELYNAETISFKELEEASELIHKNTVDAILEKETENALKISKLNSDLISGIRGWEKAAYDARIIEIDAKAAKDIKDGADYGNVMARKRDDTELAHILMAKSSDDFFDGANAGWMDLERTQMRTGQAGYDLTIKTFNGMTDALTDFVMTGKLNFESLANSIIRDLVRIAIQESMVRSIGGAIGSFGSLFAGAPASAPASAPAVIPPGPAMFAHSGGIVGVDSFPMRQVPIEMFAHAPRLHGGLSFDEFPAILQYGETVTPKDKAKQSVAEHHYETHVHLTVHAMDGRSVSQALAQHQSQIVGMVQIAYNKMGKRGPLGA